MKIAKTVLSLRGWKVTTEGWTFYVKGREKRKACEAVESFLKYPPGALTMDITRHDGPLPDGCEWLGHTRQLL